MSALLPIINRLILQSPDSRSELAAFAGKTLTLNIAGLKLAGRITEDGLLSAGNGFADTEITFRNSAVQKILQGGEPGRATSGSKATSSSASRYCPCSAACVPAHRTNWHGFSARRQTSAAVPPTSDTASNKSAGTSPNKSADFPANPSPQTSATKPLPTASTK